MGNKRGEIATILTLGVLAIIGVTTVVSSIFLNSNKKVNTNSRADEPTCAAQQIAPDNWVLDCNNTCNRSVGGEVYSKAVAEGVNVNDGKVYGDYVNSYCKSHYYASQGQAWCIGYGGQDYCMRYMEGAKAGKAPASSTSSPTSAPTNNDSNACRNNPSAPPNGYSWVSMCSISCSTTQDCVNSAPSLQGMQYESNGAPKAWCYGFSSGNKCMYLVSSSAPQPTAGPAGSLCYQPYNGSCNSPAIYNDAQCSAIGGFRSQADCQKALANSGQSPNKPGNPTPTTPPSTTGGGTSGGGTSGGGTTGGNNPPAQTCTVSKESYLQCGSWDHKDTGNLYTIIHTSDSCGNPYPYSSTFALDCGGAGCSYHTDVKGDRCDTAAGAPAPTPITCKNPNGGTMQFGAQVCYGNSIWTCSSNGNLSQQSCSGTCNQTAVNGTTVASCTSYSNAPTPTPPSGGLGAPVTTPAPAGGSNDYSVAFTFTNNMGQDMKDIAILINNKQVDSSDQNVAPGGNITLHYPNPAICNGSYNVTARVGFNVASWIGGIPIRNHKDVPISVGCNSIGAAFSITDDNVGITTNRDLKINYSGSSTNCSNIVGSSMTITANGQTFDTDSRNANYVSFNSYKVFHISNKSSPVTVKATMLVKRADGYIYSQSATKTVNPPYTSDTTPVDLGINLYCDNVVPTKVPAQGCDFSSYSQCTKFCSQTGCVQKSAGCYVCQE